MDRKLKKGNEKLSEPVTTYHVIGKKIMRKTRLPNGKIIRQIVDTLANAAKYGVKKPVK